MTIPELHIPEESAGPGREAEDRLYRSGVRLFSRYGYDGTSTRMIADDANVNISAIKYYFGSKEEFYQAVLRYAASFVAESYREIYEDAQRLIKRGISRKEAEDLLERIIRQQIYSNIEDPSPKFRDLIQCENQYHRKGETPIADALREVKESLMTTLLGYYRPDLSVENCYMLSCLVCGCIKAYGSNPLLFGKPDPADTDAFDRWRKHHSKAAYRFAMQALASYTADESEHDT